MARRTQAEVVSILKEVPLFANLTQRQLKAVAKACTEVHHEDGATIMRELEDGQQMLAITSGTAAIVRNGRTVARVGKGDVVGEMSLIDGYPRSASVVARSEVEGVVIYGTAFRKLLDEHPSMTQKLLLAQTERLRETDRQLALRG